MTRRRSLKTDAVVPIREQLVALRKKRGLTQKQLAELMGVSQPVVAEFELGAGRGMQLRTAIRAAAALGAEFRVDLVELRPERRKTKPRAA